MKRASVIAIVYALIIIITVGGVMTAARAQTLTQIDSMASLSAFSFEKDCATILQSAGDTYNNMLLTPDELAASKPNGDSTAFEHYATYRFTVPVEDGVVYGLTCRKSDYALNIYVDGTLLKSTGRVAGNKEDFIPTSSAYEVFFTGKGDTAEIVIQRANFNHYKNYSIWMTMGPADKIAQYNRQTIAGNTVIAVVLMTSFLINIGLFLYFTEKKELLYFSLLCLLSAVHTAVPAITAYIYPDLNWYVSHKLEVSTLALMILMLYFYTSSIFKEHINPKTKWPALIIGIASSALFIFAPASIYTRCNEAAIAAAVISSVPLIVSLVINLIKDRRNISFSNKLEFIGIIFVILIAYNNSFGYEGLSSLPFFGLSTGFALFVFFNSIALAVDFRNSKELLEQSKANEEELSQTNELLTRLDRIRSNFLADLSHELKTPLTIIASRAAVASKQIRMGRADEATAQKLDSVEREAVRLGEMVERMKTAAVDRHSEKPENLDLKEILLAATDFSSPLCARNGNTLDVICGDGITAYTSANMLFHCLYNLISNATRHCANDLIEIEASANGSGIITVSVRDHGEGMTAEQKEHAFDRGYSGDSGTGIGLALCREMIENENGRIYFEDTEGGGLTVCFTIREAEKNGENTAD